MALTMAVTPFALAVLNHTGLQSVPLVITSPPPPALAFRQYAVDLKTVQPTTVVEASYVFENRSAKPIRIALEPSCGCLTPRLQGTRDNVIEPGDHGRVVVRMQPANTTPGPHEYTVNVKYTDTEPRETPLTLKLVVPRGIWVTPPALAVSHPLGSSPTVQDFTVTDGRGKPFEITDVSCNSDLVEAVIGESTRSAIGNYQQSVRVSIAGDLPTVQTNVVLKITTDDPDMGEIRVPLRLQGRVPTPAAESDQALDHERQKSSARLTSETIKPREQQSAENTPAEAK